MRNRTGITWMLMFALIGATGARPVQAAPPETVAQREMRMAWWREAKFGLFIHWGIYSVPAGRWKGRAQQGIGEWIMQNEKIPMQEYAALAGTFNPVKFDAADWASLAREAGMKYVVITSKHHDGFAMFHSKVSAYNVVEATPFKRDVIRELGDAVRGQGLKFGVYYSQAQDWGHPGGAAIGGHWDAEQAGDFDRYLKDVAVPQVRELLTGYAPLSVLWWDTPENMTATRAALFQPLLALQPGLITNNRLCWGVTGDTETPEQEIPAQGYAGRDWETCMTINDTWGYKVDDRNWKSAETLLRNLVDIVSKGGNYLLNVGPTAEGVIPAPCIERLRTIGAWLRINGESVYGTTASPFKRLPWGRCTAKPGRLYLHVFDRPRDGDVILPGLSTAVTGARLLADPRGAPLSVARRADGWSVTLPAALPDAMDTVVILELAGPPVVTPVALRQAANGTVSLAAIDAVVHGAAARYEQGGGKDNIGYWTNADDWVEWPFDVTHGGDVDVLITFACDKGSGGATYAVTVGAQELAGSVAETGSWTAFVSKPLGRLTLPAGRHSLCVKPRILRGPAVMNLRSIMLMPVR